MRQGLALLFLIFSFFSFSQTVPQRVNYQGVVRSPNGKPIANKPIGVKFRILQGSTTGAASSSETYVITTNALGLFSTEIGSGTGSTVSGINWANGPYFLEVSVDTLGQANYLLIGTQELVSVPYALYAQNAGSAPSPALNFLNNVLTVGSNTTTIPIPLSPSSIITYGALTSTLVGSTYNLSVPVTPTVTVAAAVTLTNPAHALGLAQVIGSYPNYSVVVAPQIAYNPTVGILSLSSLAASTPSYNYNYDITPLVSLNGSALSVGPPTNSVNLLSLSSTPLTTINIGAGGAGTVTSLSTNNFSITVPQTTLTGAGVSGSFPSYTITGGAPSVVTASGTAGPVVSVNSNTYNVSVPAVTLVTTGALTQTNNYPTITLNTPSVTIVDNPNLGFAHVSGSFPNYSITVAPAFNYNPSTGSLVISNTFSPALTYSFNVTPTLSYNSGTLTSGPGTNTVFIPSTPPPVMVGTGAATVATSANNFTVAVPIPSISSAGGANVTGAYPSFTVNAPAQLALTTAGATTLGGTYPNLNIGTPLVNVSPYNPVFPPNINGGLLSFFGTYPNYSLAVMPQFNYSSATGSLVITNPTTLNSFSYNITPSLSYTNNVIQSGPTTNTVAIITPAAQSFVANSTALTVFPAGTQLTSSFAFTKQSASSEIDVFLHCFAYPGIFALASEISFELRIDGVVSTVSAPHYITGSGIEYITLRGIFSGLAAGPHTVSVWAKVNAGTSAAVQLDPGSRGGKIILKETY